MVKAARDSEASSRTEAASCYHESPVLRVTIPYAHVALVEMQRAPVNAFNLAFWTEFGEVFDKLSADGDVRCVVLASRLEKAFTAGLDLNDASLIHEHFDDAARKALALHAHIQQFQHAIAATERCRVPVIAAVHGFAIGLGVDILCACDVRYASEHAVFSIKEIDIGLAPDIGTLARLPKIAGNLSRISELAYTGASFSARDALDMGFLSRVIVVDSTVADERHNGEETEREAVIKAALGTAREIASKSPVAVASVKRLLLHARDHSVSDNLDYTAAWNAFALQSSDTQSILSNALSLKAARNKMSRSTTVSPSPQASPPTFKGLPKL